MPIFKFIDPETKIIIEQYRDSVFDNSFFNKDGKQYKLLAVLDDYNSNAALISSVRHIFFGEKNRTNVMRQLLKSLTPKDRIYLLSQLVPQNEWTLGKFVHGAQDASITEEEKERLSKIKNQDRAKLKRSKIFGKNKLQKSEIAKRGPTKITPMHLQPDKLNTSVLNNDDKELNPIPLQKQAIKSDQEIQKQVDDLLKSYQK